ncbi:hypothetical protein Amet_1096 [Alkaliphilus metalliredigens QYMF]|uniref:DUF5590 domain-containing protein n=1 Tax=Alkaliphilus metalliredigens (strain QYMF) TaxID=293826 RepID=A6TM90_ALKMQ|nr:hypothetical protein [Alkaliphilus metalliredigens]ABR47308.1 hypothetical protein Amet_1096 [Alkaliphilus metalliredigens QYMF]
MKKDIQASLILFLIISILVVSYSSYSYYFDEIKPRNTAKKYNIDLLDRQSGPYYNIYYGLKFDTLKECYLIFVKNHDEPFLVFQDEGVSKTTAESIAKDNGFKPEHIYLDVSPTVISSSKIDITKYLRWIIQYEGYNERVKIDFVTGAIIEK